MKIYQCKSEDMPSLVPILEELGLSYEETLRNGAAMARAAERVREVNGMNHVVVPLSECLMTACLGTVITWDPELGDRVGKEVFADWSEAESFRPESIRRELLDPLFEAIRIPSRGSWVSSRTSSRSTSRGWTPSGRSSSTWRIPSDPWTSWGPACSVRSPVPATCGS